jgi:hypothetical protein
MTTVTINISNIIAREYADRMPDHLPLSKLKAGKVELTLDETFDVLADADYNSDSTAVDVGRFGMPLSVFRSYRALAKQARAAIAKATAN